MTITAEAAGVLRKLDLAEIIPMAETAHQLFQLGVRLHLLVKTSVALAGLRVEVVAIIVVLQVA
jgi:hypothetical protein